MLNHFTPPHTLSGMPPQTPILIALSGGADSVCLLSCLREYAATHGTPLRLCHVNHGIRGEEAVRDREFCIRLAETYGLPISVLDVDIPAICERESGSLEEVARRVRYDCFARVMAQHDIPLLATAHHADDQLETILLRLTRGTGPDGLCGIPPVRPIGRGKTVIRPLLTCLRSEIEEYLAAHGLPYVIDSTNADMSYARNRIRHAVIPHLRAINPAVAQAATRLSASLRTDGEALDAPARAFAAAYMTERSYPDGRRCLAIPCREARELSEAVRRRVVLDMMRRSGCPSVEDRFVCRLSAMAVSARGTVTLPGEITARCERGQLILFGGTATPPPAPMAVTLTTLPLTLVYNHLSMTFSPTPPDGTAHVGEAALSYRDAYAAPQLLVLSARAIRGEVSVRTRREGDEIVCRGHHRKLKKLFCDLGVPRPLRDSLPILCDEEGILCIPGVGVRDGASATPGDRAVYLHTAPTQREYSSAPADQNRDNE